MAQTWRANEKAQRRQAYLSSAAQLFAERGYRAVSIEDLGAAVGVSGPALYRHFASKEAMLIELLTTASRRLLVGLENTLAEEGDDLETLQNLIAFHVDFALAERDIIRIQDRELANLPPEPHHEIRQLQRRYIEGWAAVVSRLRPDLSAAELEVKMHAVFGIVNSTPFTSKLGESDSLRQMLAETALVALIGSVSERVETE